MNSDKRKGFINNPRIYGSSPFNVAVIHGGPGAPGHMAPVARELSVDWGVLEPLQSAGSIEGQIQELRAALNVHADLPVALIGSSWGAMLGWIFSARYPDLVRKLILVGSGVYEDAYATGIIETRMKRLGEQKANDALMLLEALKSPLTGDRNLIMAELGKLFTSADAYSPLTLDTENLEVRHDIFQSVWNEAKKLRSSGELLNLGKHIECPVIAVHGDYDPHPAEGIKEPLSKVLRNFQFILLEKCGHLPWFEKEARDTFYKILREQLR